MKGLMFCRQLIYNLSHNNCPYQQHYERQNSIDIYEPLNVLLWQMLQTHSCLSQSNSSLTLLAPGDFRTDENIGLATQQTIWLREHNRVATIVKQAHSDWDDETVFQEARRITVAEYQHIIFNEFLPVLVGQDFAKVFENIFGRLGSEVKRTFFVCYLLSNNSLLKTAVIM